ncbi:RNA polymerase sigma factor [Litchfieldia alkalitelluris]|uniref:RNA polymerase sigma factor n=1 Tax=Litchfieldia alkalitelluris TaxID=304268 RepID=UPI00099778F6|nr:RNA polymerase sigma factor [Litchfieldia alkalitelluris]
MNRQQIISEWFHQYSDDIYHYLIYRIGATDVEDLVQEVFIKAIKGFHSFEGNSSPKTWLFSIARNIAIDEIRRRSRQRWKEKIFIQQQTHLENESSPIMIIAWKEEAKELFNMIQSLKPHHRDAII